MTISALNTKTYAPFNFFFIFAQTHYPYLSIYISCRYIYIHVHTPNIMSRLPLFYYNILCIKSTCCLYKFQLQGTCFICCKFP